MVFREGTATHDSGDDRYLGGLGELAQFLAGVGGDDAAADVEDGPLRLLNETDDFVQLDLTGALVSGVPAHVSFLREDGLSAGLLNVFRDVDQDWAGSASLRDVEGFFDD